MNNALISHKYKIQHNYSTVFYVFIISIILNCESVFVLSSPLIGKFVSALFLTLLSVLVARSCLKLSHVNYLNEIIFIISLMSYIIIFSLLEYISYNNILPINILISFISVVMFVIYFLNKSFVNNKGNKTIIDKTLFIYFENVMCILSIVSLLFWALFSIGLKPNMAIHTSWAGGPNGGFTQGFDYLDFIGQGRVHLLLFKSVLRNTGIFIEAPMYAYILCIALFVELFVKDTDKILTHKTLLLLFTIFSTTSSVGITIAILALLMKYIESSKYKINASLTKIIISVILCVFLLFIAWLLLKEKIQLGNSNGSINYNSSYFLRMDDMSSCLKAWNNHIFIGNGLKDPNSILEYMNITRIMAGTTGIASGFFKVLALGGVLYSAFYLVPTIMTLRIKNVNCIAILSLLLFMEAPVMHVYIYMMLLGYLWSNFIVNSQRRRMNYEKNN